MELVVGSTNPSKVRQLTAALLDAGVRVIPADGSVLPTVPEEAGDVVGNALAKAAAFAVALRNNCLAMDAGLSFPDLERDVQPGPNVRRLPGARVPPDDDDLLAYYTDLCDRHGGRIRACWTYGFAIATTDLRQFADRASLERTMVSPPSRLRHPGYPLDSLLLDPLTGRYLAEFTGAEEEQMWQATIGRPLAAFVRRTVEALRDCSLRYSSTPVD